ncbi:MAG: polyphosphate kinase 1 [Verrucomicrobiae bacterium]|nr:polyphosphate kinase 1 [Verrucomicrobiae bacterium]
MSDDPPEILPQHFTNRELSWLEFNQRVLDEALDPRAPLLERVKFFCITSSNLDEFFEVRVAGVKQQIESEAVERSVDGLTSTECFLAMRERVLKLVRQQFACWKRDLVPALEQQGVSFLPTKKLTDNDRVFAERFYREEVHPALTPLGIDSAHPFPQLLNKSLNVIVRLNVSGASEETTRLAIVQVPRSLPRLVPLPRKDGTRAFVFLGNLIGHFLADLFPGNKVVGHWMFRVTRNSELYIDEEDIANLLRAVEEELHNRRRNAAVRLEIESHAPVEIQQELLKNLKLTEEDLYRIEGPINPVRLMAICEGDHSPELRDKAHVGTTPAALKDQPDYFSVIRQRDILLHHPFESFSPVCDFLAQAAEDRQVLAIKQTLYRTGGDPRIIGALMRAVRNGKQVTAVVELRARFDEANNIQWARQLEEAGVHVVYGLVGYKIHSKMTLVVRKDPDGIRRYLHLATGNYNPGTAKHYTDLSLLTCQPDLGEDIANLFNLLTGICQFQETRKMVIAPFQARDRMIEMIERESENARRGLPAKIIAKMNSLVDPLAIAALYRASRSGVKIELIVRGICCLRPGVPGLSENIRVRSIIDRFLEHSRIYYFENACQPEIYVGSADWMPRNFDRRIETIFPILDGNVRERIISEILEIVLRDNCKARFLKSDGTYTQATPGEGEKEHRSQAEFIRLALRAAADIPARKGKKSYPKVRVRKKPEQ